MLHRRATATLLASDRSVRIQNTIDLDEFAAVFIRGQGSTKARHAEQQVRLRGLSVRLATTSHGERYDGIPRQKGSRIQPDRGAKHENEQEGES